MKSIGLKLWVWMMGLVGLLLILLWLFQIVFLDNVYTAMKITELKKQGGQIVRLVTEGDMTEAKKQADKLAYDNNANITILDSDGGELYSSGTTGSSMQMPMAMNGTVRGAVDLVLSGQETELQLTHPRFGNDFYFIGIPIKNTAGNSGAYIMNTPLVPVRDTAKILQKQLGIITIILLFVTIIFAYFLSKTFTKPIRVITRSAEEIASGNYDVRSDINSKDEIGILSEKINNMAMGLSKVEQLRKDLVANVSHELRTPLTLIRSYAETIRDVTGDNPQRREAQLDVIIQESERLGNMVDDLLNLSRLQSGEGILNLTDIDLADLIQGVADKFDILSRQTGVEIIIDSEEGLRFWGDREKIEQVLINLINNALNHTTSAGKITIIAKESLDGIRVTVQDTGSGIPKDVIDHIWERYYKGRGKEANGTGLGLAIVKSILDAHGARYGAESIEGQGTEIWFELRKAL